MAELQLPLPFKAKRLHRRTDPVTSMLSAEGARTLTADHHRRIMAVLSDGVARTAEQIADEIPGLDDVKVSRRLSGLKDAKQIERTGEKRMNRSGRLACMWRVA